MSNHVKCYSSFPVFRGKISPQWWIKVKKLVFRLLPKMINPSTGHYWILSACAVSLPAIVLSSLLPSLFLLLIIWKEGKNVWIEKGDFPTVSQLGKVRYCGQVPILMPRCTVLPEGQCSCNTVTVLSPVWKEAQWEYHSILMHFFVAPVLQKLKSLISDLKQTLVDLSFIYL